MVTDGIVGQGWTRYGSGEMVSQGAGREIRHQSYCRRFSESAHQCPTAGDGKSLDLDHPQDLQVFVCHFRHRQSRPTSSGHHGSDLAADAIVTLAQCM